MRGIGTDNYYVATIDPATGDIPVSLSGGSIAIDFSGPTGDPVPADAGFVGGVDQNGDLRGLAVDTGGRLQIDAVVDSDFSGPTGAAVPAEAAYMAGINGGNLVGLAVDASGNAQVDVLSSALPTGAATEAKQDDAITELDAIQTSTDSIDVKIPTQGQKNMAGSLPVVIASDQSDLPVAISASSTISVENFPTTVAVNSGAVNANTIRVTEGSKDYSDAVAYNYSTGNVTTAAWTQVIASVAADFNLVCITDQSGQVMELGVGASSSEIRIFMIAPGFSGCIPLRVVAGSRLSVKAVSATASSGYLTISGMY